MSIKNIEMRERNEEGGWSVLHPITKSENIITKDGKDLDTRMKEIMIKASEEYIPKEIKLATISSDGLMSKIDKKYLVDLKKRFSEESADISGEDIDDYTENGIYSGSYILGTPQEVSLDFLIVEVENGFDAIANKTYVYQTVKSPTKNNVTFIRRGSTKTKVVAWDKWISNDLEELNKIESVSGRIGKVVIKQDDIAEFKKDRLELCNNSSAKNNDSIAIGNHSIALGQYTTALGSQSEAEGPYAVALGGEASAMSSDSIAIGRNTKTVGIGSVSIGKDSKTTTNDSVALGNNAVTESIGNISIGRDCKTKSSYSIAIGNESLTNNTNGIAIGSYANSTSDDSMALGAEAISFGGGSTSVGSSAKTESNQATAIGSNSIAGGSYSLSAGYMAKASGRESTAIGEFSKADGVCSVALGSSAFATEDYSVAIGPGASTLNANIGYLGNSNKTTLWEVPGSFIVGGTKNFEMPHPNPKKSNTHKLRHSCVESPTAGDTLYRYEIEATKKNEVVEVKLPDYFEYLNKNVEVWVNGVKHFGRAYADVEKDTLKVTCETAGKYRCLIIGTRNDNHQDVQDWDIRGVEREIGESWTGETFAFEVEEITEVQEIKEEK